jgi:ABC-type multidrug transport system ATPase subunit/ABC-type multidrug transport system permease subunit
MLSRNGGNTMTPNSSATPSASWTIGSDHNCDVVVASPGVSARHCRIILIGTNFVLEDLASTNGTFVNDQRLQPNSPVQVSQTDKVTLGLSIPMPWPANLQAPAPRPADASAITIGRNPECSVHLDFEMISWDHARITRQGTSWTIEDCGSRNGTAINRLDNKIKYAPLDAEDDIYLGSYKLSASQLLTGKRISKGPTGYERIGFRGSRMVVGRDPACELPLDNPLISRQHAVFERGAGGITVEDLDSRNGTYVDGVRITKKTSLQPGQEIELGSFRFQLLEDGALAKREYAGNVTIEVAAVSVNAPNGVTLLDPISLTIFPSELVALMGPAGAGKTTFLKALNGYTRPAAGHVLFNGEDLYRSYNRFRQQMSYVPQDDIVHPQLTVREALYFSAKLRTDLKDAEIELRIDKVLNGLGIIDKKDTIIGSPERKVLSGGQRKRVNIAMELINDTPVIFLDEPTSGLSSYDAEGVINLLKALSIAGKTIIITIHQPSLDIFKEFDSLIMVSRDRGGRGALVYFGPAHPDSIEFFEPDGSRALLAQPGKDLGPELLLSGLAKKPTSQWTATYETSRYKSMFVTKRAGKVPSTPRQDSSTHVRAFGFAQWWTLVRRNIILKARDRMQAFLLLIQAPLFALLVGGVFIHLRSESSLEQLTRQITGLQFLLVVAAIWFGCNSAARDIVGEWTVYQRERMVSLKLPSYVFSKFTIAAVLSLFQCFVMLGIVYLICGVPQDFFASLGVIYAASLVGVSLGLFVSAIASTSEVAIALLPLILLPMIALGGGIHPVRMMTEPMQVVAKIVPSSWAFEANLVLEAQHTHVKAEQEAIENSHDIASDQFPLPRSSSRDLLTRYFGVMGAMLVFWLCAVLLILRRRDIQ